MYTADLQGPGACPVVMVTREDRTLSVEGSLQSDALFVLQCEVCPLPAIQCGPWSQLCPPLLGCLQLPTPVLPCAQRLLRGCFSQADNLLRGSPRVGFPSQLSAIPQYFYEAGKFRPHPQGLSCPVRTGSDSLSQTEQPWPRP